MRGRGVGWERSVGCRTKLGTQPAGGVVVQQAPSSEVQAHRSKAQQRSAPRRGRLHQRAVRSSGPPPQTGLQDPGEQPGVCP